MSAPSLSGYVCELCCNYSKQNPEYLHTNPLLTPRNLGSTHYSLPGGYLWELLVFFSCDNYLNQTGESSNQDSKSSSVQFKICWAHQIFVCGSPAVNKILFSSDKQYQQPSIRCFTFIPKFVTNILRAYLNQNNHTFGVQLGCPSVRHWDIVGTSS